MESHYCKRSSSRRKYLEPFWKSKQQLYKLYKDDWCVNKGAEPLSTTIFHQQFEENNLSLFRPYKDECETCVAYRVGNIGEEE